MGRLQRFRNLEPAMASAAPFRNLEKPMNDRNVWRGMEGLSSPSETLVSDASPLASGLSIRRAEAADFKELADLANLAGGDTLSFIAQGIYPMADTLAICRDMIADPTGIFSFRNCFVAELDGSVIGLANAFPARLIENELIGVELTEREKYLLARTELNDPRSYLLNNMAVNPAYQRSGVGARLMKAVVAEAREQNFSSITLHVWADNTKATAFYEKLGFIKDGYAAIPWHPELPHVGGSFLFRLPIRSDLSEGAIEMSQTVP
jgi:ribosomal protein S18 acetylase RimI-like enzyme